MAPAAPAWQPPMGTAVGAVSATPNSDLSFLLPVNRDVFAFASECLGLLSLIPNPVTSIAAIVCGVLGLHRLKSSTQLGR
jgi:hypothetical protein